MSPSLNNNISPPQYNKDKTCPLSKGNFFYTNALCAFSFNIYYALGGHHRVLTNYYRPLFARPPPKSQIQGQTYGNIPLSWTTELTGEDKDEGLYEKGMKRMGPFTFASFLAVEEKKNPMKPFSSYLAVEEKKKRKKRFYVVPRGREGDETNEAPGDNDLKEIAIFPTRDNNPLRAGSCLGRSGPIQATKAEKANDPF
ncbi:1942_t:CDS:2 [Paraglomus occultum]|uniref:1942_t:CDS:1 n=1 Tax=Paraglomus occultum TaxID=144539 RepID=A0A9N9FWF9_9GLOM|nr:1942_t:CDS:2 [Paraglomus occultum]